MMSADTYTVIQYEKFKKVKTSVCNWNCKPFNKYINNNLFNFNKMKTAIVTFTKVYKREVEREVPQELLEGKTNEEIADFLIKGGHGIDTDDEGLFDMVEYEEIPFDEYALMDADTDRYDIWDGNKKVYGGHL